MLSLTLSVLLWSTEDYEFSCSLLRKARALCADIPALVHVRVQTLNNLACCQRRQNQPLKALSALKKALAVLTAHGTIDGRAVTHLNVCAILSQLNRHSEALGHAEAAVLHCQEQLTSESVRTELNRHSGDKHSLLTEKIVILGIAYHNLGVEEEYLGHEKCLKVCRSITTPASPPPHHHHHLHHHHFITLTLLSVCLCVC